MNKVGRRLIGSALTIEKRGRAETLTVHNMWSGRGQSDSLTDLKLLKPSVAPADYNDLDLDLER
jgi:hypothetical protein